MQKNRLTSDAAVVISSSRPNPSRGREKVAAGNVGNGIISCTRRGGIDAVVAHGSTFAAGTRATISAVVPLPQTNKWLYTVDVAEKESKNIWYVKTHRYISP